MEAQLARVALEEAGIRCVVLGEPVVGAIFPTGIFSVMVQVFEADAERAAAVLNERTFLADFVQEEGDGVDGEDGEDSGDSEDGKPLGGWGGDQL
jgi:hypothetical protein